MERAIPGAGLEIPAGRDDFGLQRVIPLPGDLTKIGERRERTRASSSTSSRSHMISTWRSRQQAAPIRLSAVRHWRRGARVVSLQHWKASSDIWQDLSDRLVVAGSLETGPDPAVVAAERQRRRGRESLEAVDPQRASPVIPSFRCLHVTWSTAGTSKSCPFMRRSPKVTCAVCPSSQVDS